MTVDLASLGVSVEVTGVNESVQDLNKLASTAENTEKSLSDLGAEAQNLGARISQAMKQTNSGQGLTGMAGAATGAASAMKNLSQSSQQVVHSTVQVNDQVSRTARATNMTTLAWTNLGYQVNDVISGIAMGQPVMQIAAQQAGQFYSALSGGPGGVKGALKEVGAFALAAMQPLRLLGGGFVVAGAAALYLGKQASDANKETERVIRSVGAASQATVAEINSVSMAASSTLNLSVDTARQTALSLVSTGAVHKDQILGITQTTKDLAKVMGTDLAGATEFVTKLISDNGDTARDAQKQYGMFSSETIALANIMKASGNHFGATTLFMQELGKYADNTRGRVSWFSKEWDEFTTTLGRGAERIGQGVSKAFDAINSAIDPSNMEKLTAAQGRLTTYQEEYNKVSKQTSAYSVLQARTLEAKIAAESKNIETLKEVVRLEKERFNANQKQIDANKAQPVAEAAVRSQIPGAFAGDELKAQVGALQNYIKLAREAGRSTDVYEQALTRAQNKLQEFEAAGGALGVELKRIAEDTDFAIRSIEAYTGAMDENTIRIRASLEAEKAYTQERRASGDTEIASAKARSASAQVYAQAAAVESAAIRQINQDRQNSIMAIQAETWQQRAAAEASKAYAQVLAETGSVRAANAAASAAADVVMAQGREVERRAIKAITEDYHASAMAIQAETWQQRAAAEATKAYNQVLRETQSTKAASTAADAAASLMLLQGLEVERRAIRDLNQDRDAAIQSIQAETWEQKAAAAATQAYNQVLRQTQSTAAAATAARNASAVVMAQAAEVEKRAIRDLNTDFQAGMQSLNAFTTSERAAAAATQAYNQVLRETQSVLAAQTAAHNQYTLVVEKDNAAMRNQTRILDNVEDSYKALSRTVTASAQHTARNEAEIKALNEAYAQGIDVTSQYAQAMITAAGNAAAAAQQYAALKQVVQATFSNNLEVEYYTRAMESVNSNTAAHQEHLAVLKAEMDLRKQGISLLSSEAQAYMESARAAAAAAAAYQKASSSARAAQSGVNTMGRGFSSRWTDGKGNEVGAPGAAGQMGQWYGTGQTQDSAEYGPGGLERGITYTRSNNAFQSLIATESLQVTVEGLKFLQEKQWEEQKAILERQAAAEEQAGQNLLNTISGLESYLSSPKFQAPVMPTMPGVPTAPQVPGLPNMPMMPTAPTRPVEPVLQLPEKPIRDIVSQAQEAINIADPTAYGAEKNANYFYDPSTRKTFLEQFGIDGKNDSAQTEADKRYAEEVARWEADVAQRQLQYQTQLEQYNNAVAQYEMQMQQYELQKQAYPLQMQQYENELKQYEMEVEAYKVAASQYDEQLKAYDQAMKQYDLDMAAYNKAVEEFAEVQKQGVAIQGILAAVQGMAQAGASVGQMQSTINNGVPSSVLNTVQSQSTTPQSAIQQQLQLIEQRRREREQGIYQATMNTPPNLSTGGAGHGYGLTPGASAYVQTMTSGAGSSLVRPKYGFAEGGEFTVGGRPGRDANSVMMDLTRGERVSIKKRGQGEAKSISVGDIHLHGVTDMDSFNRSRNELRMGLLDEIRSAMK